MGRCGANSRGSLFDQGNALDGCIELEVGTRGAEAAGTGIGPQVGSVAAVFAERDIVDMGPLACLVMFLSSE
jgi:hypothetical protein